MLAVVSGILIVLMFITARTRAAVVTADFSKPRGYPLSKNKINLYNTTIPGTPQFERDNHLLYALRSESMRIEMNWGVNQTLSGSIGERDGKLCADWSLVDHWQMLCNSAGIQTHWGYAYCPYPFRLHPAGVPPVEGWKEVCRMTARHLAASMHPPIYHEIWNEPDNSPIFFQGKLDDYLRLYQAGSLAVKSEGIGKVGGPAVAFPWWYEKFLKFVSENKLPLDFFSCHVYGKDGWDWPELAAKELAKYPQYAHSEILLDEYNTETDFPANGPLCRAEGAAALLDALLKLLERPYITATNWAQFQDPAPQSSLGMVSWDGHARATYNAVRLYGLMPVTRYPVQVEGGSLSCAASSDANKTAILMVNRDAQSVTAQIRFTQPLFAKGRLSVYRIDKVHCSYGDGAGEALLPVEQREAVRLDGEVWQGDIPSQAVLCVIIEADPGVEQYPRQRPARLLRVNRHYANRLSRDYADYDSRNWCVQLGCLDNCACNQQLSLTADALPELMRFRCELTEGSQPLMSKEGSVLRVDYHTAKGCTYGVMYGLDTIPLNGVYAFGTQRAPDIYQRVSSLAQFDVNFKKHAPKNWDGRVDIGFSLQTTSTGTTARWSMEPLARRVRAVNCGADAAIAGFEADHFAVGGINRRFGQNVQTGSLSEKLPAELFLTARCLGTVWYAFKGYTAGRTYRIRLYFVEVECDRAGERQFDVYLNDRLVLSRYDICADAGGKQIAVCQDLFTMANAAGYINLRLVPYLAEPRLSAVSIYETAL